MRLSMKDDSAISNRLKSAFVGDEIASMDTSKMLHLISEGTSKNDESSDGEWTEIDLKRMDLEIL